MDFHGAGPVLAAAGVVWDMVMLLEMRCRRLSGLLRIEARAEDADGANL